MSRPRDPGCPEHGIGGGEEAGVQLVEFLKTKPNSQFKNVPIMLYDSTPNLPRNLHNPAKGCYITDDFKGNYRNSKLACLTIE
jgi:hypothetical protein